MIRFYKLIQSNVGTAKTYKKRGRFTSDMTADRVLVSRGGEKGKFDFLILRVRMGNSNKYDVF